MQDFEGHGIRFRYPASWTVTDESTAEKVAVTVQSDGTAFWTVAVFPDAPRPERVVESAIAAYREDYTEIDVYPVEIKTGPRGSVVTRDLEFVCLELIAAAHVESFETGGKTVLVLFQASDAELESSRPVLDAMTASLEVAESSAPAWPDEFFSE
ncbi:MAG: hypothetical protein M3552_09585 [Planctomycetota bacterium]|nr:hypothetical protein [Planctomycetaceae bacterium]MDQ3330891.1 hypothetical protein [Planctomycetota bacterium]